MKESIEKIVNKYLQLSNYKVDSKSIDLQLLTHPDYPSIKAISDTYDYFGIENIVANVPFDVLNQLPDSFIGLIDNNLHLINKTKNAAYITNQKSEKQKISFEKLKETWNGIIIAIEPQTESTNANSIKKEYLLLGSLLLSSILPLIINFNIISIAYSICTFFGFLLSYFVVKETFGNNNKTVNKFCGAISKKESCSNVINNTNSKLFNLIHLSDACIVYFSSLLLFLIFVEFDSSLLFLTSLFSLPVILYSMYYQALIIKDWCALCIGISVVLITQFLILFFNFNYFLFDLYVILKAIIIIALISILWHTIKNLKIENLSLESTNIDFIKFKRNKNLFNELLSKKQLINNDISLDDDRIYFGSNNPKIVIIAVTNPLCGFCAESFQTYYEILNKYEDIQINFVFSLFTNDLNNPAYRILNSFFELYYRKSKEEAIGALKEWFDAKDFNDWIKKHNQTDTQYQNIKTILEKHLDWTIINNIHQTPTTIINNYYYPYEYNINDIFYFIDDMLLENKN